MTRSLKSLWGRLLFRDRGVLPAGRLLWLFAGLMVLFIVTASLTGISWTYIAAVNALLFAASLIDLAFSPGKKDLTVSRSFPEEMERGRPYEVVVEIANSAERGFSYAILDGLPRTYARPFPVRGKMNGRGKTTAAYTTTAGVRGDDEITELYFRYRSPLGLWEKQITYPLEQKVKVIPDLSETRQYLLDAQRYLLHEGVKVRKYKSGSGEFAQIRQYVPGDDPRMINWRQTAKLQEVMANEHEPEHGKYVTVLIDCGRMMGAELRDGNRLEKALEAALTVSAAALRNGDYVSVLAFSRQVKVFVPPAKGIEHLQTILQSVYNLEVDAVESDYAAVFTFMESMQKKRSLLLLFSDIRTFLYEENTLAYLLRLRRRHLFLMLGIEDEVLEERIRQKPADAQAAMVKSIAQQQALFKKREKAKWENQGLLMTEAAQDKLAVSAVSHYIDMMNRNLV